MEAKEARKLAKDFPKRKLDSYLNWAYGEIGTEAKNGRFEVVLNIKICEIEYINDIVIPILVKKGFKASSRKDVLKGILYINW